MGIPSYNAAPLAMSFLAIRSLTLASMIGIVGMAANFVSEIVNANIEPPTEIIATLSITCVATLYCLLSIPFFLANAEMGLLIMTGFDCLLLIAFVTVSVILGKPLSFLNCSILNNPSAAANATDAFTFSQSLISSIGTTIKIAFDKWSQSSQTNCYEAKAIWGLCISLCVLFTCSALILPSLWFKSRKSAAKSVV